MIEMALAQIICRKGYHGADHRNYGGCSGRAVGEREDALSPVCKAPAAARLSAFQNGGTCTSNVLKRHG